MGKGVRGKINQRTPEEKENYLINLAIDLVEKQLIEGTATSQVISHFLRLATTREKLENEKLRSDLRVAEAKINQINMQENISALYNDAIEAMKSYRGENVGEQYDEDISGSY